MNIPIYNFAKMITLDEVFILWGTFPILVRKDIFSTTLVRKPETFGEFCEAMGKEGWRIV